MADHVKTVFVVLNLLGAIWYLYTQVWDSHRHLSYSILEDVKVPEELQEHRKEFERPEIIKVRDGVYVAIGYALANTILLIGPEGLVIVDTTESVEQAAKIKAAFREITQLPIKAIIHTHFHGDHNVGTRVYLEEGQERPDIWAHETSYAQLMAMLTVSNTILKRSMRQFGTTLPDRARNNAGIGIRLANGLASGGLIVLPNKFVHGSRQTVDVAGLHLILLHIPGESDDQIGVWIPEWGVLLPADDIYRTFPNLYAIRGTPPRDVVAWVNSLDLMRDLRAEYLVPSHTQPIIGADAVYQVLTTYRDGIQFVHDQTVRYMNKELHPDEIVRMVHLPPSLAQSPFLKEFYGTVEWSVKTVFDSYLGWFSGDPSDLLPLSPCERASRLAGLLGGTAGMMALGQKALAAGDERWALELASMALRSEPQNSGAKAFQAQAIKSIVARHTSANGRNYLLTSLLEDQGLVKLKKPDPTEVMKVMPMSEIFKLMTVRVKAEKAEGVEMAAIFNFTDIEEVYRLVLRNCVLEVRKQSVVDWTRVKEGDEEVEEEFSVKVTVTTIVWRELVLRKRWPIFTYLVGDLKVEGGLLTMRRFLSYFETDDVE